MTVSDLAEGFSSLENGDLKLRADFLGAKRAEYPGSSPSDDHQVGENSQWRDAIILRKFPTYSPLHDTTIFSAFYCQLRSDIESRIQSYLAQRPFVNIMRSTSVRMTICRCGERGVTSVHRGTGNQTSEEEWVRSSVDERASQSGLRPQLTRVDC